MIDAHTAGLEWALYDATDAQLNELPRLWALADAPETASARLELLYRLLNAGESPRQYEDATGQLADIIGPGWLEIAMNAAQIADFVRGVLSVEVTTRHASLPNDETTGKIRRIARKARKVRSSLRDTPGQIIDELRHRIGELGETMLEAATNTNVSRSTVRIVCATYNVRRKPLPRTNKRGAWRVCINGRYHELGKADTPEAKAKYEKLIEQWRENH